LSNCHSVRTISGFQDFQDGRARAGIHHGQRSSNRGRCRGKWARQSWQREQQKQTRCCRRAGIGQNIDGRVCSQLKQRWKWRQQSYGRTAFEHSQQYESFLQEAWICIGRRLASSQRQRGRAASSPNGGIQRDPIFCHGALDLEHTLAKARQHQPTEIGHSDCDWSSV